MADDFIRQGMSDDTNHISLRLFPGQLDRVIDIFYRVILPIDGPIQGNDPRRILRTK